MNPKMPVLFISHGAPDLILSKNPLTEKWQEIASRIPTPKFILCISAHDLTSNCTTLSTHVTHPTIHDFGGFAEELYQVQYPAPGSLEWAQKIQNQLGESVQTKEKGLDHGTWTILSQMYPDANIPVIQMSLNRSLSPTEHFVLGQRLQYLRNEDVLIVGSGGLVHNLRLLEINAFATPDWALEFENWVIEALKSKNYASLCDFPKHPWARRAHPTDEHFLPLLYIAGLAQADDQMEIFNQEFCYGSLAMTSFLFTQYMSY